MQIAHHREVNFHLRDHMSIQITVEGETASEVSAKLLALSTLLGGTAAVGEPAAPATTGKPGRKSKSSAQEPSEAPKTSSSDGKADVAKAVGATAEVVQPEDDGLGEEDDGLGDDVLTREDVKALLIEVKTTFVDDTTAVGKLVASVSKAARKLADVPDADLQALGAAAKKKLGR